MLPTPQTCGKTISAPSNQHSIAESHGKQFLLTFVDILSDISNFITQFVVGQKCKQWHENVMMQIHCSRY